MRAQTGFTLVEMLVAMVVGSLLMTGLFRIWNQNKTASDMIASKGDFRDRVTLATTQVNRSITMAGFGISKMEVVRRAAGSLTDTLVLYSNESERRTTLVDSAARHSTSIKVFKDSGFVVGGLLGITDSIKHEFARIQSIQGNETDGFTVALSGPLANAYSAGVPDIYPVTKERIFADAQGKSLVRYVGDRRQTLGEGITQFKVQLLDHRGSAAAAHKDIRVITFSLVGSYKATAGATPAVLSFNSTVIPRNIL